MRLANNVEIRKNTKINDSMPFQRQPSVRTIILVDEPSNLNKKY